jgi:hypothetical protein
MLGDVPQERASARNVLDLCDAALIANISLGEAVSAFTRSWGRAPNAIALPLVTGDGVPFEIQGIPYSPFHYQGNELSLSSFLSAAESETGITDFYYVLDPDLAGEIGSIPWLLIEDIVGDTARHLCFGNPQVQGLLGTLVSKAIEALLPGQRQMIRGLTVDAVNLWPMGATNGRIEPTCFCSHCREYLRRHGVDMRRFEGYPSPWNLLLKRQGIGTRLHIRR